MKKLLGGLVSLGLLIGGIIFASHQIYGDQSGNGNSGGDTKTLTINIEGSGNAILHVDGVNKGWYLEGQYEFPTGSTVKVTTHPSLGWELDHIDPQKEFLMNESKAVHIYFTQYLN